jgi:hypothetical protein
MNLMPRLLLVIVTVVPAATACAVGAEQGPEESPEQSSEVAQSKLQRSVGLGADGDSCTVRTGVPGTEKDGECCATADPKDCVIILKPFPKEFTAKW